jgi:hypothetical protein
MTREAAIILSYCNLYSLNDDIVGATRRTMSLRSGVTSKNPPNARRDAVMISHDVEDNIFTRWLALQLARNG